MLSPPPERVSSGDAKSADDIRVWVVSELASALQIDAKSVSTSAPLHSFGADSLTAITLTGALAEWLQRDIPATLMWDYDSIDAIAEALGESRSQELPDGVIRFQPGTHRPPLFCFPGVKGHCMTFAPLASALEPGQPCYGLNVPGMAGEQAPLATIEEIAAVMLRRIKLVQPTGPYQFTGYSFGGLLAFEAAQQLTAMGEAVSVVVLYDTFTPQFMVRPWQRLVLHAYVLMTREGRLERVRGRIKRWNDARRAAKARAKPAETAAEAAQRKLAELERINVRAFANYRPRPYDGQLLLFRATKHYPDRIVFKIDSRTNGWGPVVGSGLRVIDVPGRHDSVLSPEYSAEAASLLRPYLLPDRST